MLAGSNPSDAVMTYAVDLMMKERSPETVEQITEAVGEPMPEDPVDAETEGGALDGGKGRDVFVIHGRNLAALEELNFFPGPSIFVPSLGQMHGHLRRTHDPT
ncbi:MAG: hypothetical protein R2849_14905 [Thermomicrobiales bacterium]